MGRRAAQEFVLVILGEGAKPKISTHSTALDLCDALWVWCDNEIQTKYPNLKWQNVKNSLAQGDKLWAIQAFSDVAGGEFAAYHRDYPETRQIIDLICLGKTGREDEDEKVVPPLPKAPQNVLITEGSAKERRKAG